MLSDGEKFMSFGQIGKIDVTKIRNSNKIINQTKSPLAQIATDLWDLKYGMDYEIK